jgi:hypothetical protein
MLAACLFRIWKQFRTIALDLRLRGGRLTVSGLVINVPCSKGDQEQAGDIRPGEMFRENASASLGL